MILLLRSKLDHLNIDLIYRIYHSKLSYQGIHKTMNFDSITYHLCMIVEAYIHCFLYQQFQEDMCIPMLLHSKLFLCYTRYNVFHSIGIQINIRILK